MIFAAVLRSRRATFWHLAAAVPTASTAAGSRGNTEERREGKLRRKLTTGPTPGRRFWQTPRRPRGATSRVFNHVVLRILRCREIHWGGGDHEKKAHNAVAHC